jgi:hypothetical protein
MAVPANAALIEKRFPCREAWWRNRGARISLFIGAKDIAGSYRERYGRCRISSSGRRLEPLRPSEISVVTQSQPWPDDRQSWIQPHSL